ncbi:MAG: ribosome maturation factor RimP [Rhodospirillaceae bacterium]
MNVERRIGELISPALEALGYELVRVQVMGSRHKTMQVMAERLDEAGMTVDDCAAISREISALLDVDDPISEAYDLEVSSPGIDRPLVKLKDFDRFVGFDARVEMYDVINGRKKFKGKLIGLSGEKVEMKMGEERVALPYDGIRRAKLLLTDELIEAAQAANG